MNKRKLIIIGGIIVATLVLLTVYWMMGHDVLNDEDVITSAVVSSNLEADKAKMWILKPKNSQDDNGPVTLLVSPVSAINAASRVMETEKKALIGLTFKEVLKRLNHVEAHRKGSYNFPFFYLPKGEKAMVLRFDCGNFGWQFDLLLDDSEKVREVRRQWIH